MTNHLVDELSPKFAGDARIEAVETDDDGLIVRIGGELIRVALDAEFGRTVFWGQVRKLSPGETDGGAAAALRYNTERKEETGLVMGFFLEGSSLLLGKSVDVEKIEADAVMAFAERIQRGIPEARTLLEQVLEEARREEAQKLQEEDVPLMRV